MQPKKLALVHAETSARRYLAQTLKLTAASDSIVLLDNLQRENISSLADLIQVSLDPTLFSTLPWTQRDAFHVASCAALLNKDRTVLQALPKTKKNALRTLFHAVQRKPSNLVPETFPRPSLFVGDARLASLRTFLTKQQIPCHFQSAGRLHIPQANMTIYKADTTSDAAEQLVISGATASDAYFSIQRLIQQHLLPI